MTYTTPQALRMALERRLGEQSLATGVSLDRLRRRVVFQRVFARLHAAQPGVWVLKGGMAMEVRLGDQARLTKDIDLGLREAITTAQELTERLVEALSMDPFGDRFELIGEPFRDLMADDAGYLTWRSRVTASLAGKYFGRVQLDVSPRGHELRHTDRVPLPNALAFAGIAAPEVEVIDVHRHAAEKYHAMHRDHGERQNTRVRDLVDLVILIEASLLEPGKLRPAVVSVWAERERSEPPERYVEPPASWVSPYERMAADADLRHARLRDAVALAADLWGAMHRMRGT